MIKLVINIDSYLSPLGYGLRPLGAVYRFSGFYRSAAGEPVVKSALKTVTYGLPKAVSGSFIGVSGKLTLAVSLKLKALKVSNRNRGLKSPNFFYPLLGR